MKILNIIQSNEIEGVPYVEGQSVGFDDILADELLAANIASISEATSFTVHTSRVA